MKKLIYGIFIGISYLIPGLCSASLAITLGVYEDLIEIFSSFYKPKTIKKHAIFLIGMLIGSIIAFSLFVNLYKKIPYIFTAIFIGFIIGSIKKNNSISIRIKRDFLILIITVILMFSISLIGNNRLIISADSNNSFELISLFFIALLTSIALILPGISGSMILFAFGKYDKILEAFKSIITSIVKLQTLRSEEIGVILVFFVGLIAGIIAFSKIIDKISKVKKELFKTITFSFLVGSMLVLLNNLNILINASTPKKTASTNIITD